MEKKVLIIIFCWCATCLPATFLIAQPASPGPQPARPDPLPAIVKNAGGGYTFLVDGQPFVALGAQLWNSSDWPYILDKEWPQLRELHCNTLEAPVYWQNIEPEPGKYNFKELDSLIDGARKEGLRLVLLWFGSYKNGSSSYAPEWVLSQPEKYPRMLNAAGEEIQVLSALSAVNREADKAAFSALMRRVRQIDGQQHTVILVQVENESGSLGTDRDYSAAATAEFKSPVPASLLQKLGKQPGTWEEVFGVQAAEAFSAYSIASYVNEVAGAGQREYGLPMYANVWLREYGFRRPGEYPSGGPVSTMLPIWKAAAPALAFLAPDIYEPNYTVFTDFCGKYARPDNPFFLPEMGKGIDFARGQFYALGNFNAMGVAVYGIDPFHADPADQRDKERLDEKFFAIADNYRLLRGATGRIAELQGTGRLQAVGEEYGLHEQLVSMGDYDILFSFGFPAYKTTPLTGRVLVGQLGADEFLVIGFDARFQFRPRYGSGYSSAEYLVIEEGYYDPAGQWVRKRIWNGDEAYHSTLTPEGEILRIRLRKAKKANTGTGLITLTLTLDGPVSPDSATSAFSIEPAALKYNKDFAWSFTLDDGYVSAFLVAFPYFKGGRVAASYIDQWGHDQGGDGLRYPGLFFTDGCGNRVSFRAGLAINARSVADTPAAGMARSDHPGHLSWRQISDMYNAGWDIFNHGYAHATGREVDAGSEVRRNNQAVAEHLGFWMSQFVVPGGKDDNLSQEPYAQAAFEQGMAAVHCGGFPQHWVLPEGGGLPDQDGELDHLRAGRLFVSSRTLRDSGSAALNDTAFFDGLPGLLAAGKKAWINVFTHGVGNDDLWNISLRFPDFKALFDKLATRYGEKGRDNIWMASFQAVQEYLLIRQSMRYQVRREGQTVIVTIDTTRIPAGLRHKTMTFCWTSQASLRGVSCQGCTVESFSRSGSPQLVNIDW